ncbi:hypothetical protein D3C87_1329340 [compost metagenome]
MSLDRDENVYVVVPGENKIYRFVKSLDYAKQEIAGFDAPWGIAFSDTTPQAMFVSNTGDGIIRRVTNPATAIGADGGFAIPAATSVRGLAYMASGTPGTGTLYMANGTRVEKANLSGNAYVGGSYANYFTDLPVSWSYLHAKSSTGELFGYGSMAYAHLLSPPGGGQPNPVVSTYMDYTGWARLRGFTFDPAFNLWRSEVHYGGLTSMSSVNTTREVELAGSYLYVASPDSVGGGGILRVDLSNSARELLIPLQTYSLGIDSVSGNLYAGAVDGRIYRVDAAGKPTQVWNLGTVPYGLDVRGSTVWAVGADGRIFEQVIGDATIKGHKFGLKEPGF